MSAGLTPGTLCYRVIPSPALNKNKTSQVQPASFSKISRNIALYKSKTAKKIEVENTKVTVTGKEDVKIVFTHILVKSGPISIKPFVLSGI